MNDTNLIELLHKSGISLNSQQLMAVRTVNGPVSVFAGPGSGKTTVITCRLAYMNLVLKIPLSQCMVMTFTRAAAKEMSDRLQRFPGMLPSSLTGMEIGTFHSIFYRLLLRDRILPNLLTREEHRQILSEAIRIVDGDVTEDRQQQIMTQIGLCKNHLIQPEMLRVKRSENIQFKRIFAMYEAFKIQKNRIDFDDILVMTYDWLRNDSSIRNQLANRFRYFVVDEFQDTNLVQYRILQILAATKNLFIVGDDDQAIYGFRGANVKYMLDFEKDFPDAKQIVLGTNYRSHNKLIHHTSSLINKNQKRWPKEFSGTGRDGNIPVILEPDSSHDEALAVINLINTQVKLGHPLEQIAVLYRTHLQARNIVDMCIRTNVPFFMSDQQHSFYDTWYIRNIVQYLTLANNPDHLECLIDIVNRPKRYIYGPHIRQHVTDLRSKKGVSALDALTYLESLEGYQIRKLKQFQEDVKNLRKKGTKQAIEAVLYEIGYMQYVEEYSKQIGLDVSAIQADIQAFLETAESFSSVSDFISHTRSVQTQVSASKQNKHNGLQLMTFHKAKGLEFKDVFILGAVEDMVPHQKSVEPQKNDTKQGMIQHHDALEEERRLFYVACTRAKDRLFISAPKRYLGKNSKPSVFIQELMDVSVETRETTSV